MDERIEQLITRRLDGEITEQESLELDKQLIRSPEARAYLGEQRQLDTLAGEALRAAVEPGDSESSSRVEVGIWPARVGRWRYWSPIAAVAAALALAVLVATLPFGRTRTSDPGPSMAMNDTSTVNQTNKPIVTVPVDNNWSGLPRGGRHEVIGVYDDVTQSLYLLEMSPHTGTGDPSVIEF